MTCGMTTAFSHAAEGDIVQSFLTQPMGFALALGTASAAWIAAYIALTGSTLGVRLAGLLNGRTLAIAAALTAAAWAYKIAAWSPGH